MKTINELRDFLKAEYVGKGYSYSTAYSVGNRAKALLEENFEKAGLTIHQVFVDDNRQTVNLKVRGASGYDHTFIEIKIKKAKGEGHYHYCGSAYDWTISDIEVKSWEAEKTAAGNYEYIQDLDRIANKVAEYLNASNDAETKRIKQGADIVEALKKEYGLNNYYEVNNLITYISKHFYTIEKEIKARHPELTDIL